MSSTHTPVPRLPEILLCAAAALVAPGCAGLAPGGARADDGAKGSKDDDEDDEAAALARKLEVARLELELARLQAEQELASAERALAAARVEADKTRLEREGFSSLGRARELDEARLGVDQSRGRAEDAAAELAELEAMYAAEEFAAKTKELVLTRGRRDLELSRRALDLSVRKLRQLEGFGLAGKERELEQGQLEAEKGLLEAEQALAKLRLEQKIAIAKAEQELEELARKAEKAEAKKAKQP